MPTYVGRLLQMGQRPSPNTGCLWGLAAYLRIAELEFPPHGHSRYNDSTIPWEPCHAAIRRQDLTPLPWNPGLAWDSPGTKRMQPGWGRVTSRDRPSAETQLLSALWAGTRKALWAATWEVWGCHAGRKPMLPGEVRCREAQGMSQLTAVPPARQFSLLAIGPSQPVSLPIWGRASWNRDEHSLLGLFWIPDPRNLWLQVS